MTAAYPHRTGFVALLAASAGPGRPTRPRRLHPPWPTALIITPTGGGTGWVVDLDKGLLVAMITSSQNTAK